MTVSVKEEYYVRLLKENLEISDEPKKEKQGRKILVLILHKFILYICLSIEAQKYDTTARVQNRFEHDLMVLRER